MWNTQKKAHAYKKTKEKIKKPKNHAIFSSLWQNLQTAQEYNDFQKESSVSGLCEETLQINFNLWGTWQDVSFFFYMLNLERSIVRIILPHRRWMSRDFEDLSEELYRFNKMNQMCQVIKLWSNAELTVEKTQEHIKALGIKPKLEEEEIGDIEKCRWWGSSEGGGGGISFSFQRHSHWFPRYTQTAAAASNPVHFPRVRCDDSSWSWLMLACHVYVKCAYCLESKQQDGRSGT